MQEKLSSGRKGTPEDDGGGQETEPAPQPGKQPSPVLKDTLSASHTPSRSGASKEKPQTAPWSGGLAEQLKDTASADGKQKSAHGSKKPSGREKTTDAT